MKQVEQLLRERIGLDPASVGSALIERTVRLRMKTLGLRRIEDYDAFLQSSAPEWEELVESVVVGETWFFRDREPFTALARLVLLEWFPANPTAPLRLLSVPCSSGEEPYSMAMALIEAGLNPGRFRIDAADISARALARARRGIYGRNSFRGSDLGFRDRHFLPVKEGYALRPALRGAVHFHRANLLSDDFLAAQSPYDFVFCRNLLIYFDRPTQHKALARFEGLLTDKGFLFVGPAELPLVVHKGFVSANIPMAFVCRRSGAAAPPEAIGSETDPDPMGINSGDDQSAAFLDPQPLPTADGDLETARRLADAGRLAEATVLCHNHLQRHGASAQAYYLLGLIHDAHPDSESGAAADYYRKALYLEPNHYEALVHSSLLCAEQGDTASARVFRTRAQRVQQRNGGKAVQPQMDSDGRS